MSNPITVDLKLTTAQAVSMIKRAPTGTRFALHVRTDLPIDGESNRFFPDGGAHYLNLSRQDALNLAQGLLSPTLEARGGRMLLQKVIYAIGGKETTTIWFC